MEPITITLCLLVFAIVMFVWEKVPLAVTSMVVCVALVVTGVLDLKQAFAGFIDSNVILFVAMFIVGGALFETGMANKVGGVITHFAKTEKQLIFTIMVVVGVMSGFLSNTGTAAVLIPVVIGVAAKSGFSRSRLLMPLVFAAALGGNLSLIGAPGNLIAQSALQNIGSGFGFFEYAKVGLPMLVCGILYFLTIGYKFLPNNPNCGEVGSVGEQRDYSHVPRWKQILSLVVLIATILGMIFEKQTGISLAVAGCIGALVLVVTGVLTEKQAYKAIDSQTIFIFGGTLALAKALEMTGAGKLVADQGYRSAGQQLLAVHAAGGGLCPLCGDDQLYVQYRHRRAASAGEPVDCRRYGRRSACGADGDGDWQLLRLCDADRDARQYDGAVGRGL